MGLFNFGKKKDTPAPAAETPKPAPAAEPPKSEPALVANPWDGLTTDEQFEKALEACGVGDYETALPLFEHLAEQGNVTAQYNCGQMYYEGEGTTADYKKSLYWYEKAAQQNEDDAYSQFNCGKMYYNGEGTAKDMVKAKLWLQKATEQGHEEAEEFLREHF